MSRNSSTRVCRFIGWRRRCNKNSLDHYGQGCFLSLRGSRVISIPSSSAVTRTISPLCMLYNFRISRGNTIRHASSNGVLQTYDQFMLFTPNKKVRGINRAPKNAKLMPPSTFYAYLRYRPIRIKKSLRFCQSKNAYLAITHKGRLLIIKFNIEHTWHTHYTIIIQKTQAKFLDRFRHLTLPFCLKPFYKTSITPRKTAV